MSLGLQQCGRALATATIMSATLAIGVGGTATAQPAPTAIDQLDATLVSTSGPFFLLFWSEDRGAGHQIFGKRIRTNGFPVGAADGGEWAATAPTGTGPDAGTWGDQRFPAVYGDVMVWSERAPGASDYDIYAQRLHNNGRPRGDAYLLLERDGDQLFPDIIQSNRDYIVVFSEDLNDEGDVMGLRTTSALRARGEPFAIAEGPGLAEDPVIARDLREPRKTFTVLFTYTPDGATTKDIYGARVTESGLPRGGASTSFPVVVDDTLDLYAPELLTSISGQLADPSFPVDKESSLLLYTRNDPAGTDGPEVIGQRLRGNGFARGGPIVVAGGPGEQSFPTAVERTGIGWLVAWQDNASGDFDILSIQLRSNGIPFPPSRRLATD